MATIAEMTAVFFWEDWEVWEVDVSLNVITLILPDKGKTLKEKRINFKYLLKKIPIHMNREIIN